MLTTFVESVWTKITLTDDHLEFEEYQSTWLLRLSNRLQEITIFLLTKSPTLYAALTSPVTVGQAVLRKILQFFFGIFLGFLFYRLILVDLQLDPTSTTLLAVLIMLCLGIGNVVSPQVRCISLLIPLKFGSYSGRAVISSLVVVYLTAGPISNISRNLSESVRVILCQMGMTFSQLKTKFELLIKPLGEAFARITGNTDESMNLLNSVDEVVQPLNKEIQDDQEVAKLRNENDKIDDTAGESRRSIDTENRYTLEKNDNAATAMEKKYLKKLQYRCESMASKTLEKCRKVFGELFYQCQDSVHWMLSWVCYAVKVFSICNFFAFFAGGNMCHPDNVLPPGAGRTFIFLNESRNKLWNELADKNFHYKIVELPPETKETLNNMYDAGKVIIKEFKEKKTFIDTFILIIMRCTAFSFILIILSCNKYIHNYLNDIEFDNHYITLYFRKIDYRRFAKGKFTLLPLKQAEKRELSDVYQFHLTTSERGELVHSLIATIILFFFSVIFVIIDEFLYFILSDLRTYGYVTYTQVGHHDLSLDIKGVGFIASIIRSLVRSFKIKRRIKRTVTNEECLPRASPPGAYNFKIFGSFFLLFLFVLLNAWILGRLNRFICSQFFPKAEKTRILYLYNQRLKKRITYLNYRLDIVKREAKVKKSDDLTFYLALRLTHPKLFGWLTYFNAGRRKCLICQEEEPKKGGISRCANVGCYMYFDDQCWYFVVKQKCIGCPGITE